MMEKVFATMLLIAGFSSMASADMGKWVVKDSNVTCLIVSMSIKVNFTYTTAANTSKVASYVIPVNETSVDAAGSHCNGEKEDILKVSWKDGNAFEMTFRANDSKYDLSSFVITLNSSRLFNDSMANQTLTTLSYNNESFDIPANFSYHCNREQQLNATDGSSLFFVSKVQFEAFRKNADQKFSAAKDCDSNITPDIVPIAVGISLIALIVVVLIAYMVGRRRQQARGYLNIM